MLLKAKFPIVSKVLLAGKFIEVNLLGSTGLSIGLPHPLLKALDPIVTKFGGKSKAPVIPHLSKALLAIVVKPVPKSMLDKFLLYEKHE